MAEQWVSLYGLSEIIGNDVAQVLCRAFGGLSVYLPVEVPHDHKFIKTIGRQKTRLLAEVYGGQYIALPNLRRKEPAKLKILSMLEQGKSYHEIARTCKVSERWVRSLAAQSRT